MKLKKRKKKSNLLGVSLVAWSVFAGVTAIMYTEPIIYEAEATEIVQPIEQSTTTIREMVLTKAKEAGVHIAKIDYIVTNESQYLPTATGDLDVPCTNKHSPLYGKPAYARGLWQITRCWYPDITDEQAYDPEWSTDWALKIISTSKKDCISQWTTCARWHRINGTL